MSSVKLKLVGAMRYVSPMTNNVVVEKGQTVVVSADHAVLMLAETKTDALNNEHPLWVEASEASDEAPKAGARVTRAAKTVKADSSDS